MKAWSACAEDATSYRSSVCLAAATSPMPPSLQWGSTVLDSSETHIQTQGHSFIFIIHRISLAGMTTRVFISLLNCVFIFAAYVLQYQYVHCLACGNKRLGRQGTWHVLKAVIQFLFTSVYLLMLSVMLVDKLVLFVCSQDPRSCTMLSCHWCWVHCAGQGQFMDVFVLLSHPLSWNFTSVSEDKSVNAVFVCTELSWAWKNGLRRMYFGKKTFLSSIIFMELF